MSPGARPIRRVVVIATRQIGDVLLTTPLIRATRLRWPDAEIDVLGFAGTLGMLHGNPDITRTLEAPATGGTRALLAFVRAERLWRRYDLALVTQHSDRAHLLGFVCAPLRTGLIDEARRHSWWKRLLLVHAVAIAGDRGRVHVAAEKLSLLDPWRRAGPASAHAAPIHVVPTAGAALPAEIERVLDAHPVVVHVPSMWPYKAWPTASWRELVGALLDDGHQVVLTGGPSPDDAEAVAAIAGLALPPRLLNVAGRLGFAELATLLGRAGLYVGPDTSVTHLAAASAVPLVALFGPSNPMRWGPLDADAGLAVPYAKHTAAPQRRGRVVLMQGSPSCVPCGRAGCEDHRQSASACLERIAPAAVLREARAVLAVAAAA